MDKLLYTKYSNQRDSLHNIKTSIFQKPDGTKYVTKEACTEDAVRHIEFNYEIFDNLSKMTKDSILSPVESKLEDGVFKMDFVDGESLENILLSFVKENKKEDFFRLLDNYKSQIELIYAKKEFSKSEDFVKVFGDVNFDRTCKASCFLDIDLIFQNIIVQNEKSWKIIDFEWTFDFLIPVKFLYFRAIEYFCSRAGRRVFFDTDLYDYFDISQNFDAFRKMELHFQTVYLNNANTNMSTFYASFNPLNLNIDKVVEDSCSELFFRKVQLFFDFGNGYSEKDSIFIMPEIRDSFYILDYKLPSGLKKLRIDPCQTSCVIHIHSLMGLAGENLDSLEYVDNGLDLNNIIIFDTFDPIIEVVSDIGKYEKIVFEYTALVNQSLNKEFKIGESMKDYVELEEELKVLRDQIVQGKNNELLIKNEVIAQKDNEIARIVESRDRELALKNEVIAAKDNEISRISSKIDSEIIMMNQEIKSREKEILKKDDVIKSKEKEILEKDSVIDEKQNEINIRENIIKDKDNFINSMHEQVHAKYNELLAKDCVIQDKNFEIANKEQELALKQMELDSLKNSISWKITAGLRLVGRNPQKKSEKVDFSDISLFDAIDSHKIISFDIFDTLIFRCTNTPEDIFKMLERKFSIENFAEDRVRYQSLASQELIDSGIAPHANFDQIYDYIKKVDNRNIDWDSVKEYELKFETLVLYCNEEMKKFFEYAKANKKKVIITSDMYFSKAQIEKIINACGYSEYDNIYISSDIKYTKYEGTIYNFVQKKERVRGKRILHIGDNYASDVQNAQKAGWHTYYYPKKEIESIRRIESPIGFEYGLTKKLVVNGGFWKELGSFIMGNFYVELLKWLKNRVIALGKNKIFFLSRDGYNAYNILKNDSDIECSYLYVSRRSLLLAGITELDDYALTNLPPYVYGQTVSDVFSYIGIPLDKIKGLDKYNYEASSVVNTKKDIDNLKKLYKENEELVLEVCEKERNNAIKYFSKNDIENDGDYVFFDCGWNGSSQYLLEKFFVAAGLKIKTIFLYVGIDSTDKAIFQLHDKCWESFLFDFRDGRFMPSYIRNSIVLFELFFGAPHQSVLNYDNDGNPVFDDFEVDFSYKKDIFDGISSFVIEANDLMKTEAFNISHDDLIRPLERLILNPTYEEARLIGDIENVDNFAKIQGKKFFIANFDRAGFNQFDKIEIYWKPGFEKRNDISLEEKNCVLKNYHDRLVVPNFEQIFFSKEFCDFKRKLNISLPNSYFEWIEENEKDINKVDNSKLIIRPLFSVVVPVYNVISSQLEDCIKSVLKQTYDNFELILIDDASTWKNVVTVLKKYEDNDKIHIVYRKDNGHISKCTNDGLKIAKGDYIAFMDCDDVIAINALYEMALKINENPNYDYIYSDEDKISDDGRIRSCPFFKPDWSPDTFMEIVYTNHLSVYRRSIVEKLGGLRSAFNGSQDFDFTLRFMELSSNSNVGHISKILYHWRTRTQSLASGGSAKNYALEASKNAKIDALKRRNIKADVELIDGQNHYRVIYDTNCTPVSVIIPSKDNCEILFQCINSLIDRTDYDNYEIIVVDNGSSFENRQLIENFSIGKKIKYVYQPMKFNFSKMCNIGARIAEGQVLLFLNDDIEIFDSKWLSRMVGQAIQPHTGAVGAKLYYPKSKRIQHCGVTNLEIGPSHSLLSHDDVMQYYFGRNTVDYNLLCVTAACLAIEKIKFEKVNGFNEDLEIAYNDVDLCFKLYEYGFYNIIRNDAMLYHHESLSRGNDDLSPERKQRQMKEMKMLYDLHPKFRGNDPFYNINLSDNRVDFALKRSKKSTCFSDEVFNLSSMNISSDGFSSVIDEKRFVEVGMDESYLLINGWVNSSVYNVNRRKVYVQISFDDNTDVFYNSYKLLRQDVANSFNNTGYFSGFESRIRMSCEKFSHITEIKVYC